MKISKQVSAVPRAITLKITGTFLLVAIFTNVCSQTSSEPELFNLGRTRCIIGMAFSQDGKTLYHTTNFKPDSTNFSLTKITVSTWKDNSWSEPEILHLTRGVEAYPVLSPDGRRLYFSSNAVVPGEPDDKNFNIWCSEKAGDGWKAPYPVSQLNTGRNEHLVHVDSNGVFYISSDRAGTFDIYRTIPDNEQWAVPAREDQWNTDASEDAISVYPELGITFLQRTNGSDEVQLFFSTFSNGGWSPVKPLNYDYNYPVPRHFAKRFPCLSPD